MAKLKIIRNTYDTFDALKNVFAYVMVGAKSNGYIGAQNMLLSNISEQLNAANDYYYNTTRKKVIHFIIAFAPDDYISPADAFKEGYNICKLLPEYQITFSVHQNTDNLHMHFAMNPISLYNGHKFYFDNKNLYTFAAGIRKIFEPYDIKISCISE